METAHLVRYLRRLEGLTSFFLRRLFGFARWICGLMSLRGKKRTSQHVPAMSALPPKADIGTHSRDVCFVPKEFCAAAKNVVIRSPRRRAQGMTLGSSGP